MSATNLTVRVGLLFDEKSLAGIERSMKSAGQRLSRIGGDLTLSLSAPLAALGITAIKAAGDIESLTLALKSQLGSADAAGKELDKLTEAAKNPGLGVEQAVRGSVRLQGVGFAADEARKVLIQMGNAIASTGGSAEELDAVTKQFAQMTSKGRVLQEDVSVLSENMPGLAQLMQKAFGTANVEAIRAMGVTGKEFVLQITKAAEGLPRVESGIKNGIGNAIDSLKQSAAKVGFAINEAFDVTGAIESVSGAVLTVAQAFSSLDPWVQKTILGIAGVAIATGPLIKAYGAIKLLGSQLIGVWGGIVSMGTSLVAGLRTIATAFNALNLATRAFILIGVVAAVVSLVSAFANYSSELSNAEKAQASLVDVQRKGAEAIAGQKSDVETLVNAYKSEEATLKQKQQILAELNRISPEYFGAIKAGKGDVEALTSATARYSAELLKVAQITAAKDRLVEIEKAMLNLNKTAEPSTLQTLGNILLSNGNAAKFAGDQVSSYTGNINEAKAALTAERDALVGLVTQQTLADASTGNLGKKYVEVSDSAKKMGKALREINSDVANAAEAAKLLGDDVDLARVKALETGIKKLLDEGFRPSSKEVQNLKAQLDALSKDPPKIVIDIIRKDSSAAEGVGPLSGQSSSIPQALPALVPLPPPDIGPSLSQLQMLAKEWEKVALESASNIANGLLGVFGQLSSKQADEQRAAAEEDANAQLKLAEGNAEKQAQIKEALSQKIAQIEKKEGKRKKAIALAEAAINTAVAITKAIGAAPPPFNIPAIVAASIAGAAQIAVIAATPFAKGTDNAPGGLALVGEQGPELINLPRHSQVFPTPQTNQMLNGMGGGGSEFAGEFTVRGEDLVLILERVQRKNNRFR